MNRRSQTNQLLYQARLMLDKAEVETDALFCKTAEEAAIVFMHRAFRASLAEVGATYGLELRPDARLSEILERFGRECPEGWEYRYVAESLREPGHWMRQIRLYAEQWAITAAPTPARVSDDLLIQTYADGNEDDTNHYRIWFGELQKWVEHVRELGDYS